MKIDESELIMTLILVGFVSRDVEVLPQYTHSYSKDKYHIDIRTEKVKKYAIWDLELHDYIIETNSVSKLIETLENII